MGYEYYEYSIYRDTSTGTHLFIRRVPVLVPDRVRLYLKEFVKVLKINVLLLIHERWWLMTTKTLFLDQNIYDGKIRLRV